MSIRMRRGLSGISSRDFATRIIFSKTPLRRSMFTSRISKPHSSVVSIDRQTGTIHVWISNKVPYNTKQSLPEAIGVPAEKIVIHVSTIGGDFGGKGALMDLPLCYFLAQGTGWPVRMIMTYTEELIAGNPRHASVIVVKTGVQKDGTLAARQVKAFWDGGAYGAMKPIPSVNLPGAVKAAGSVSDSRMSRSIPMRSTRTRSLRPFRSPGMVQLVFAGESQIDMIAAALKIDPLISACATPLKTATLRPT